MSASLPIAVTFALYLAVVFALGVFAWRRTRDARDYYLGGRRLSPWVAALSAGASDMSGWVMLGLPGLAYAAGMEAAWLAAGLVGGVALSWLLVARRLRVYSELLDDAGTLPVYFQRRFGDRRPWLRAICALFILLFFLFYVSSGLIASAKLFETVFGFDYRWSVLAGLLAVICYTLFGGFLAVCWTDVFQGLLMTLAMILVPAMVIGTTPDFVAALDARNPALLDPWTDGSGAPLTLIALASLAGWGLGYFGQPHILVRYQAIRAAREVPVAAGIGVSWALLMYGMAVLTGLCGAAAISGALPDPEQVFMVLVGSLFNPWIAGVLLAAILAAIMSTIDSQLLVCSSALAEDLLDAGAMRPLDPRIGLRIGRASVLVLSLLAAWLAMDPDSSVLDVVAHAWAGLGAAFGPVLLVSLYWPRMNLAGAIAGVLTGGLTVLIWPRLPGGWSELYELVPGFAFSVLAIGAVSLLFPAPPPSVRERHARFLSELRAR